MKAIVNKETHEMLCSEVLSYESAMDKKSAMGADIFSANYQQEPIDMVGRLYSKLKTYDKLPVDDKGGLLFTGIHSYGDTADEGADYLCNIIYGIYNKEAYVLDIIYTQEPMEITEELVAKALYEFEVNRALIESNNGGKGFARSVERILKEKYKSNKTRVKWFHQSQNKIARILSNSTWVMDQYLLPKELEG